MKRQPRYKYYTNNKDVVVAVSTYAGKTVRGVAKLDPRDTFDLEEGKRIAEARCNEKIAFKRLERARKKYQEANDEYKKCEYKRKKMYDYYCEATTAFVKAKELTKDTITND